LVEVEVIYVTSFPEVVGKRNERIEVRQEMNVMDLLWALCRKNGKKFEENLINPATGKVWSYVTVLLNGIALREVTGDFEKKFNNCDRVMIAKAVSGG
jgi:molybdopterin converting factor small subunit